MSHAAIYARISSLKDDKGVSVERQVADCMRLAASLQYHVAPEHIFVDNGLRGFTLNRPALKAMLSLVQAREITAVFFYNQGRLSRTRKHIDELFDLFDSLGVTYRAVSGFVDRSTPEAAFATGIESEMNEYWRRKTSYEIKRYYAALRRDGVPLSRRPLFGLQIVGNGKARRYAPNPDTFPAVLEFLKLYAAETAFSRNGVKLLRARGVMWQDGNKQPRQVTRNDLSRIISNLEAYAPHLPPELAAQCLKVKAKRANRKENGGTLVYPLLCRRVATCATCGIKLHTHRTRDKRGVNWFGYRHEITDCAYAGKTITRRRVDDAVIERLDELAHLSPDSIAQIKTFLLATPEDAHAHERAERVRLQSQLDKLVDEWLEVGLTPEQFRAKRDKIQQRLSDIPDAPPPTPSMTEHEADALLANLSENLALLARINPAEGNKVIASLFRLVAVDYGTRETVARYTWENV